MVFKNSREFLCLLEMDNGNMTEIFNRQESDKTIIWNTGEFLKITVDKFPYQLSKGKILFLTEFTKLMKLNWILLV